MKPEYVRAVVWPRGLKTEGEKTVYRYAVVGMVVTQEPIPGLNANEVMLDGQTFGLADILEACSKRAPNMPPGDASNVLCSLEIL